MVRAMLDTSMLETSTSAFDRQVPGELQHGGDVSSSSFALPQVEDVSPPLLLLITEATGSQKEML